MAWLPGDFVHPERGDVADGFHFRPIRADDVELDYPTVIGRDLTWAEWLQLPDIGQAP